MAKSALGGNVLEAGSGGPASNTPTMTGSGRMTDVVADAAVWLDRARMADEAAQELDELVGALADIARRNVFGIGCAEGQALFEQLNKALNGWRVDTTDVSVGLRGTASRCREAAAAYETVDRASSSGMSR